MRIQKSQKVSAGYIPIQGRSLIFQLKRYKWVYLLFLPAFTLAFIFNYMPMYGVQIAFRDFRYSGGIWGSPFVGLKHFIRMFSEYGFLQLMYNTLAISLLKIVLVFPSGILFALMLNEIRMGLLKKVYQTISYLPHFLSWVVLAGIIREVTSFEGPINTITGFFGAGPKLFLTDTRLFVPILILTDLWQTVGWNSIICLAAIAGVPADLYESADLDGAGRLRKMWSITIPSILPVIIILFILRLGGVMNAGFDQIFNLYNPMVYSVADIIDTYIYRVGLIGGNFSNTAAIGLFKNIVGVILVLVTNYLSRKLEGAL
jgi:putative aldouronate transport system permease protein